MFVWPYDFAQNDAVYMAVLVNQVASAACAVMWAATEDVIPIALMNMACGHLAELKKQLEHLGSDGGGSGEDRNRWFYMDLVDCCQPYEDCLR